MRSFCAPLVSLTLLLAGCGEEPAPPPAPPAPVATPAPVEEMVLGSAEDELVMEEEVVSNSALAALGGGGAAKPEPTPKPAPKKDTGLGQEGGRSISAAQIKKIIDRNQPQVTACYERELKKAPGLRGKVVMGFVIGADGRVRTPRAVRNTTGSRPLSSCIARTVKNWRFPRAEGPADVEYPFAFKPRDF